MKIKSKGLRRAGNVSRLGEMINSYRKERNNYKYKYVRKNKAKDEFEDHSRFILCLFLNPLVTYTESNSG